MISNVYTTDDQVKWNFQHAMFNDLLTFFQSCDRIRAAYDNLDSAADIEAFIRIKGTSMNIPGQNIKSLYDGLFTQSITIETPKYTSFEDTEDKPKPTIQMMPRTIREINIPVEDEELRSVNDQLNKLPSIRTTTLPMV